jgi:Spy/CpxP family protein refolding chaperone
MARTTAVLLGLMLALASCLVGIAQDAPPPGGGPPGGGPPGGRGFGRGGGMMNRWLGASVEELQKEINITPEQREKIDGIVKEVGDTIRARFEQMRSGGGGGDFQTIRTEIEKIGNDALEKVKGVLTPEQQEKFTKLVADRRAQFEARRAESPFASPEQRVTRALETLKIADAQEAEAVKALLEKIVKLQGDIATFDRTSRDKAGELLKSDGMTDDALEERLKGLRAERKALEDQLRKAQEELAKVVTTRQEVELFRQSILR